MRHSLAHVLAMAVLDMFPEAKLGIGPATDDGFYYDFDLPRTLIPEDLPILEKKMRKIVKQSLGFEGTEVPPKEAIDTLKAAGQPYKVELAEEFAQAKGPTTFYKTGSFTDLCRGGHVKSTKEIGAFTLTRIAGAYWRGDESRPQLQRIYGVAFASQEELDAYLEQQAELATRDHRKLGPELELFHLDQTAPGMPYWLPKGMVIINTLLDFWRKEHSQQGYQEISAPIVNKKELWEQSGHWDHYKEEMFIAPIDEDNTYGVKPMNCPNAMVVFGLKSRSYRDLPLRLSDCDALHRNERSGTLHGLLRVQSFRQDDSHNFVEESQIEDEYKRILEIADRFYHVFGLSYSLRLGTRPEKFLGDSKTWDKAEAALRQVLDNHAGNYQILDGDGAFYGPKVDILMKDVLGREWQMGTIQLDFQLPQRFGLKYSAADGSERTPVVIHRVIYGSLERFIGILIEHFAGAFPLWLSPEQARVLPIADRHNEYAASVAASMREAGLRVSVDDRAESVGKKIREAEVEKTPYMLVVGDKEAKAGSVALRSYHQGDRGTKQTATVAKQLAKEAADRALPKTAS